jgi:hypothetical protein
MSRAITGPGGRAPALGRLDRDLESGRWDEQHGHLRELESFEGSLRLVVSEPE